MTEPGAAPVPTPDGPETLESLPDLLARVGLGGVTEEPFPNDGWSGASLTLLRRDDEATFVLKRDSLDRDWIARATRDGPLLREAWFAARGPALPEPLAAPYLGAARDGVDQTILMPDLSGVLFDWDAPVTGEAVEVVLAAIGELHAAYASEAARRRLAGGPWCPLAERLTLISRASLERPGPARDAVASRILPGWDAFDRLTPRAVRDVVDGLGRDPAPLLAAFDALPATLLHGDLKLANAGIGADGAVPLVDWQMTLVAPVAVELGWLLVSNTAALPFHPSDVLARYYATTSEAGTRAGTDPIGDWTRQVDAAVLVGLVLRGWRKGYDAEAGLILASGMTAAEDLAWWCEAAEHAAGRLL